MKLIPGKLYKIKVVSDYSSRQENPEPNVDILMFVRKGKEIIQRGNKYIPEISYIPYYFLWNDRVLEIKKYPFETIKKLFMEVEEDINKSLVL